MTPIARRTVLGAALAASAVPGLLTSAVSAAPTPGLNRIKLDERRLNSAKSPGRGGNRAYSTGQMPTKQFRMIALTWRGESMATFQVRTKARGHWSPWMDVQDDGHYPDVGSPESAQTRNGTMPLMVDSSDAIEIRLRGSSVPEDLHAELIDPGTAAEDAMDTRAFEPNAVAATARRPTIYQRSAWGANESIRESGYPDYGQVRGSFVHHTVGSNSYSRSDVPGIIRGIYIYHVRSRGWRDIGYNFLVDKYGRIWMGRYGGWAKSVVGAHTYGYNSYAFGAALLGTYTNNNASSAALEAFARLIAWKFTIHNVNPNRVFYPGGLKQVPAIAGHRDGGATQCPGDRLYAKLSTLRGLVANRM